MFRCELRFDEEKVRRYGYSMKSIYRAVDPIFEKEGIPKIAEGIYEDLNTEDSSHTISITSSLLRSPAAVHFCNYWRMYDPTEGDQGKCEDSFPERRKLVTL